MEFTDNNTNNSPIPSIFLHIQKTAGTSLVTEMQWHYGIDNCVSHGDHFVGVDFKTLRHTFFQHKEKVQAYAAHPFISGHFGFNFCERFMQGRYAFTFLRDPAERIISYFYFCKNEYSNLQNVSTLFKSFNTFLDMACDNIWPGLVVRNNQVWQLAYGNFAYQYKTIDDFDDEELLNLAKCNADRLDYIGFAETFKKDKTAILKALGIKHARVHERCNCTKNRPQLKDLPASTKKRLTKLTELDNELYQYVYAKHPSRPKHLYMKEKNSMHLLKDFFPCYPKRTVDSLRQLYLDMMEKTLCGMIYGDPGQMNGKQSPYNKEKRESGLDWPLYAHTMVGLKRLRNVRHLIERILDANIFGDLIETGVWRGGCSIMMRAVLKAYGVTDRDVYCADSFEGLPPPSIDKYPSDANSIFHTYPELSVSLTNVRNNFAAYGLLDEQVKFIKGWFKDTLPTIKTTFAIIRLDGDMYESTIVSLTHLYDKLSDNGYVIVDDYHVVPECKEAIHDFFKIRKIHPELHEIDGVGVFWKKNTRCER